MFEVLFDTVTNLISYGGYPIIFICMMLESMIFPLPSEAVMPFAGFLIAQGKLNWIWVIFYSTLGSIVGSMISYYIGFYGGRFFLGKYGKYFLLNKKHLDWAEKWFNRKSGWLTIFIARFIPVIRHIISIPAGIGKMKMKSFLPATILGAAIWNSFLTFVGFLLNKEWDSIGKYSSQIDYIILIFICLFVIWFIYREGKKHKWF